MKQANLALFGGPKTISEELASEMTNAVRWPVIEEHTVEKCADMIRKGGISYAYCPLYAELEEKFRRFIGSKYCLVQNNGTSTLHAAYFAVGVGQGDEVILPSHTWTATVSPLYPLGAVPVYADIDPDTLCIDPDDIEKKITSRTKAICIVHMWGNPCDMDRIMQISEKYSIPVIEDCSHAHGAAFKGKKVGSFGAVGCFSMQGSKTLPGGELGCVVTDNEEYFDRIVILGHQGRIQNIAFNEKYKGYVAGLGFKYRPFPIAVQIAVDQLDMIGLTTQNRVYSVDSYNKELGKIKNITTVKQLPDTDRTCYTYIYLYDQETTGVKTERFVEALIAEGISPRITQPLRYLNVHTIPPFDKKDAFLPVTVKLTQRMVMCNTFSRSSFDKIDLYTKKYAEAVAKVMDNIDSLK